MARITKTMANELVIFQAWTASIVHDYGDVPDADRISEEEFKIGNLTFKVEVFSND